VFLLVVAGIALVAGMVGDMLLTKQEAAYLRTLEKGKIKEVLAPLKTGSGRT